MKHYYVWSLIYLVLSLISFIICINTGWLETFLMTLIFAIWSAEAGITAKIIEHKPKEDAE